MPVMPEFTNDVQVQPTQLPTANPNAFAAPGNALAQGGAQLSDAMRAFTQKYIDAKMAMDASNKVVENGKQLNELQHKWSLVPDRQQALAGYNQDVAALKAQSVDSIGNPLIRAHVLEQFGSESLAREDEVGKQSFALESSKHRGDLEQNLVDLSVSAARAPNGHARAIVSDNAGAAIAGAVKGGWISPEEAQAHEIRWKSDIQAVSARDDMNNAIDSQSPEKMYGLAKRLSDPSAYPGMLPETREMLRTHVETAAYRLEMRAAQREARNDALAERNLHQAQAHNEAVLLAGVNAGQPMSDHDIQTLADRGQISAGGVEALHTAHDRQEDGRDNPAASLPLWGAIGNNDATTSDVYGAYKGGHLSKTTATEMVKAIDAKNTRGDSQIDKANYGVLKTALSGGAVDAGIFGDKSGQAKLWTEAQGEWNRRVVVGGEDSQTVLSDMMPRYHSGIAPTWLARPQLGDVHSSKDVQALGAATYRAHAAGTMDQPTYDAQVQLLGNYRSFYLEQDKAAASAARARAPKPGAPKAGGAQLVGVTPQ